MVGWNILLLLFEWMNKNKSTTLRAHWSDSSPSSQGSAWHLVEGAAASRDADAAVPWPWYRFRPSPPSPPSPLLGTATVTRRRRRRNLRAQRPPPGRHLQLQLGVARLQIPSRRSQRRRVLLLLTIAFSTLQALTRCKFLLLLRLLVLFKELKDQC